MTQLASSVPEDPVQVLMLRCADGDFAACDELAQNAVPGSPEERFGLTCGERVDAPQGACVDIAEPEIRQIAVVGATATSTRPDSEDACGNPTTYPVKHAFDGARDTAWMAPGDGVGEQMVMDLGTPFTVRQVGLLPGYDKVDPCSGAERFSQFRRVKRVRWSFDDGSEVVQVLEDRPDYQIVSLDSPVDTQRVVLSIIETYPPGEPQLDHTPIAEIGIAGSP